MKTCFVDKTILLTAGLREQLKINGFTDEYLNVGESFPAPERIEYLLLHGFLPDSSLVEMKNCRYIGIRAHNTDYVNHTIAAMMGITIRGLQNQYGTNAVAEHTFTLIFALAKRLLQAHRNAVRGAWRTGLDLNMELAGKKLGIVGYGKIGKRVGEIGRLLGMEVLIAAKGEPRNETEIPCDEVLAAADVIVALIPGTEPNRHFFNAERIRRIKPGALFINTARGSVADYHALEEALTAGRLAGIGLDVFPDEPLTDHPLCHYPNVICTPHVAYATQEALEGMNTELVDNFLTYVQGK